MPLTKFGGDKPYLLTLPSVTVQNIEDPFSGCTGFIHI